MTESSLADNNEGPSGIGLVIAAVVLAAGIMGGAWIGMRGLGPALTEARLADRSVSVKGLSERGVRADLALWDLRFVAADNDLTAAQAKLDADRKTVLDFLTAAGLPDAALAAQRVDVIDFLAQQYRGDPNNGPRYLVSASILLRTEDVDLVQKLASRTGELIKQGVIFAGDGYQPRPAYLFTKLNDVKLDMLAEATANARAAAQQFARDAGAQLGTIRNASQGQFSIMAGDNYPGADETRQINKTVRVVTSIDYALKD